jgi:N4-(beta-N-acetylglucosaminyl)-L-asparaginase
MERTPHVLLVGEGALQFALEQGFKKEHLLTPESEKAWHEWLKTAHYEPSINSEVHDYGKGALGLPGGKDNHDTIGMLALDVHGKLAGACTTSGMAWKMRGRVGDSPIIGAGLYVDGDVGGATSTGVGEEVIRNAGSFLVVELMRQGRTPTEACKEAVMRIIKRRPEATKTLQVGFLAMNREGEVGAYAIQHGFTYAVCDAQKQDTLLPSASVYATSYS